MKKAIDYYEDMKELVNEDLTNTAIIAIMATSIAYSLAIIADNMTKEKDDG